MNAKIPKSKAPRDLDLAEVGLTAAQLESAMLENDQDLAGLVCSDDACHVAVSEFELLKNTVAKINPDKRKPKRQPE